MRLDSTVAAIAALAAVLPSAAAAEPGYSVKFRSVISGASALPEACQAARSENGPQIAAHPDDPSRLSALYISDGRRSAVSATSRDGGRSWERSPVSSANRCSGGPSERASTVNPLLDAGPEGSLYFGNSWLNGDEDPIFFFGTAVHRRDDATGWSDGTAPAAGGKDFSQNAAVLAHPSDPQTVHVAWTRMEQIPNPVSYAYPTAEALGAVSHDGDRTFSAPSVIGVQPGRIVVNVRLARASDGALLAAYDSLSASVYAQQLTGERVVFRHHVARSTDAGRTWSSTDAGERVFHLMADPDDHPGRAPAGSAKFDLATGPDGAAAIAWAQDAGEGRTAISVLRSADGGRTWSPAPTLVRRGAFEPAVAFDAAGTLGLFFYDWSNDVLGDGPLTTDAWFAIASPDGWSVEHLDGPFDLRAARAAGVAYDGGIALGVYQDLEGFAGGFAAAYTVGPPLAADGTTDVRHARVQRRGVGRR